MWIMTQHGFFSVVEFDGRWKKDDDRKGWLMVRGRAEKDIRDAAEAMAMADAVEHTPRFDYAWRVIVPREVWKEYMAQAIDGIDYTNFKSRVTKTQGLDREGVYMRVWSILHDIGKPRRKPGSLATLPFDVDLSRPPEKPDPANRAERRARRKDGVKQYWACRLGCPHAQRFTSEQARNRHEQRVHGAKVENERGG